MDGLELIERIDRWGTLAPTAIAHESDGHAITYQELKAHSDALAGCLLNELPGDRSPVMVLGHKEPELVVAYLACIKAGHPYIPLDTALPAQRLETIRASSGARLALSPQGVHERITLHASSRPGETPHEGATHLEHGSFERVAYKPEDPFYVIYTSGSTGTPKGVVISLGNLNSFLDWMLAEHPLVERNEVFLGIVPFSFDVSIMDLYLCLYAGGTHRSLTRDEIGDPARLHRALARSGATAWISTPSFARLCLVERGFGAGTIPNLRRIVLAGEVLSHELASELLDRFPGVALWNAYGPTEATVLSTSVQLDRELLGRYPDVPIGFPRPGGSVLLMGEDGQPVAEGERGELVIVGPHVSPGYLNRPDLTSQAFFTLGNQRAYHTGDWGRALGGLLFFEGRHDDLIKLHGYRIELGDVEAHLKALPGVQDAVVLPTWRDGQPERLVAFIILSERPIRDDFQATLSLRRHLSERLPGYMLPQLYRFVDTFPLTVNGKADRKKLAEMLT